MSLVITIDTSHLGPQDVAIITAIAGALGGSAGTTTPPAVAAEAAKLAEKVAPAKKAAAAAAKPAPAPAAEPEPEVEEDLLGDDVLTKEDAVKKATELVAEGKAKDVKAALVEVGVAKVGQLETPELVAAWFAALPA